MTREKSEGREFDPHPGQGILFAPQGSQVFYQLALHGEGVLKQTDYEVVHQTSA